MRFFAALLAAVVLVTPAFSTEVGVAPFFARETVFVSQELTKINLTDHAGMTNRQTILDLWLKTSGYGMYYGAEAMIGFGGMGETTLANPLRVNNTTFGNSSANSKDKISLLYSLSVIRVEWGYSFPIQLCRPMGRLRKNESLVDYRNYQ